MRLKDGSDIHEGINHNDAAEKAAGKLGVSADEIYNRLMGVEPGNRDLTDPWHGYTSSKERFVVTPEALTCISQRDIAVRAVEERQEALKEASQLLRDADKFYADNIKLFNAQQVKAVMRGTGSAGEHSPTLRHLYSTWW